MTKYSQELSPALIVLMPLTTGLAVASNYYTQPLLVTIAHAFSNFASICALVVVSCVPKIIHDPRRLLPTITGFIVSGVSFWKTRSIITPTLLSALTYGLVWKL